MSIMRIFSQNSICYGSFLTLLLSVAPSGLFTHALSSKHVDASQSRARLSQALSSPSGKLTFSPEVVIPEPTDPTAILLQSNAIQGLSTQIRQAKANAVFLDGSLNALKTFCNEQETARGNFPGPVPVIYAASSEEDDKMDPKLLSRLAEAGAEGVLVPVCHGKTVTNAASIVSDEWLETCQQALQCGLQPIPEVFLDASAVEQYWQDDDPETSEATCLVNSLTELMGSEPVAMVLTVVSATSDDAKEEEEKEGTSKDSEQVEMQVPLPKIPKALLKRVPIIGSIQVSAGDGRLLTEANRFKSSGFLGGFLRRGCIPGFRVQLDLEIVAKFWAGCITDLKSTKSKAFSFRSKNNMEKSVGTQWANYQKSVIDSGSLGDPNESYSVVDEAAGEYKGFA